MKTDFEYGLIGHPLGHSFSKELHEKLKKYEYVLYDIIPHELEDFLKKKSFRAINVTIPYKQAVIPYLDYISDEARLIGAVNTIINKNGMLYGCNTDAYGLEALIRKVLSSLDGLTVAVLGTGGTAKTAVYVCRKLNCSKLYIVSRSEHQSNSRAEYITYNRISRLYDKVDVIINTTPVGMFPDFDGTPLSLEKFTQLKAVVDVVYNPLMTTLVYQAKKLGIPAVNGLYMLVSQAVKASELFTDTLYDSSIADYLFSEIFRQKRNIVFIGMPGSGKSTIGRMLSRLLLRKYYDTDDIITKRYGRPCDIIARFGEDYFRQIEGEVISDLKGINGSVISVGGGTVIRDGNVRNLKHNGILVYLDRNVDDITPTLDRPLSNNRAKLEKLYESRTPIYKSVADVTVSCDDNVNGTLEKVIKALETI